MPRPARRAAESAATLEVEARLRAVGQEPAQQVGHHVPVGIDELVGRVLHGVRPCIGRGARST